MTEQKTINVDTVVTFGPIHDKKDALVLALYNNYRDCMICEFPNSKFSEPFKNPKMIGVYGNDNWIKVKIIETGECLLKPIRECNIKL